MTVIHLFGEPPAVDGAPTIGERDYSCWPHQPVVDEQARAVSCARCKAALDPITVLMDVARRHQAYQSLVAEVRTMRANLEALKAEEGRVKARTRSAARKDATAAVAAERERQASATAEVQRRTDDIRHHLDRIDQLMGKPKLRRIR
jgi:hypothetical protein